VRYKIPHTKLEMSVWYPTHSSSVWETQRTALHGHEKCVRLRRALFKDKIIRALDFCSSAIARFSVMCQVFYDLHRQTSVLLCSYGLECHSIAVPVPHAHLHCYYGCKLTLSRSSVFISLPTYDPRIEYD